MPNSKTLVQTLLAAFCAILFTPLALGGGGMNIASRIGCWAKSGYTAKDYVRDGLIAMWDGIENAGWGVHDPNATTWKDLTGNHNTNVVGALDFADNHVYFDGRTYLEFSSQKILDAINSNVFSVEILMRPIQHGTASNNGYIGFGENARGFWLWDNRDAAISSFSWRSNGYVNCNLLWSEYGNIVSYVNLISTASQTEMVVAGNKYTTSAKANVTSDRMLIGKIGNLGNGIFDCFGIRVYDRALSSFEVEELRAIDNARFGLT